MTKRYYYISPNDYKVAEKNGINKCALEKRVYYGWDIDRAIKTPIRKRLDIGWRDWKTIAEQNGVTYDCFRMRRNSGINPKDAATLPPLNLEKRREIAANINRKYDTQVLEAAIQNGISKGTFYSRVNKLGWAIEKAINTPLMSNEEALSLARKKSSFREMNEIFFNSMKKPVKDGSLRRA